MFRHKCSTWRCDISSLPSFQCLPNFCCIAANSACFSVTINANQWQSQNEGLWLPAISRRNSAGWNAKFPLSDDTAFSLKCVSKLSGLLVKNHISAAIQRRNERVKNSQIDVLVGVQLVSLAIGLHQYPFYQNCRRIIKNKSSIFALDFNIFLWEYRYLCMLCVELYGMYIWRVYFENSYA